MMSDVMTKSNRKIGRPKVDAPHPVDLHVGSRIRLRRTLMGMSQEKLGIAVSVSFQQIQKYEKGMNRVGSSRLYEISRVLDVEPSYFFDEMPANIENMPVDALSSGLADEQEALTEPDPMVRRETLELVRAYYRIKSKVVRQKYLELAKSMARNLEARDGKEG